MTNSYNPYHALHSPNPRLVRVYMEGALPHTPSGKSYYEGMLADSDDHRLYFSSLDFIVENERKPHRTCLADEATYHFNPKRKAMLLHHNGEKSLVGLVCVLPSETAQPATSRLSKPTASANGRRNGKH